MEKCAMYKYLHAPYSIVKITPTMWLFPSLAAIAIALAVVVRIAAASERQFTVVVFPPTMCEDDGRTIYTSLLPSSFTAVLVFIMLCYIGLVIHRLRLKYPNIHNGGYSRWIISLLPWYREEMNTIIEGNRSSEVWVLTGLIIHAAPKDLFTSDSPHKGWWKLPFSCTS